jgi:hypothetical protein
VDKKIVWILGAGFSAPLGGPLLTQLFAPQCLDVLSDFFPTTFEPVEFVDVMRAYHYGTRFRHGRSLGHVGGVPQDTVGAALWEDAEQFLDFLDCADDATNGKAHRKAIGRALAGYAVSLERPREEMRAAQRVGPLPGLARRLLAAECCRFLVFANPQSETWVAHQRWLSLIEKQDTVVTFNYDRVVETLAQSHPAWLRPVLPGETSLLSRAPLIKLHGSVDWQRGSDRSVRVVQDPTFAAFCRKPEELVIASPGPTKQQVTKDLDDLWQLACRRISDADIIVFVGYRFPPSDATAREQLLGAIRNNTSPFLNVHTVLGPDLRQNDTVRMDALLHSVLAPAKGGMYAVKAHPLWSQDFFSVASRRSL